MIAPTKLIHHSDGCQLEFKAYDKKKLWYIYTYVKSVTKQGLELPMTEEILQDYLDKKILIEAKI